MSTDRVVRLDPKTGKSVQYLMPSDTNMRTVFVDNSTTPVTFWVGSNHDHRTRESGAARLGLGNGAVCGFGNSHPG